MLVHPCTDQKARSFMDLIDPTTTRARTLVGFAFNLQSTGGCCLPQPNTHRNTNFIYFYLVLVFDKAFHPQGICRPAVQDRPRQQRKKGETGSGPGRRHNIKDPSPSACAVRKARGMSPPEQKRRKKRCQIQPQPSPRASTLSSASHAIH